MTMHTTLTLTITAWDSLPVRGDYVLEVSEPDTSTTLGPGEPDEDWRIDTAYLPMQAPPYARPRAGHVRLNFPDSYMDVPFGTTLKVKRPWRDCLNCGGKIVLTKDNEWIGGRGHVMSRACPTPAHRHTPKGA